MISKGSTGKWCLILDISPPEGKSNPFRQGVSVYMGVMAGDLCPVAAILDYMVRQGLSWGSFLSLSEQEIPHSGPVCSSDERGFDPIAGFNPTLYAGHSFWIGVATMVAQCGLPDSLIKTLGRWQSSAYTVYIRTPGTLKLCAQ